MQLYEILKLLEGRPIIFLTLITQQYLSVPWRDMRNILIHEYFGVHSEIVWQTVTHDFRLLQPQLDSIKQYFLRS